MKKIFVLLAAAALVLVGSMAFAAEVTVGGSVDIRSRLNKDLDLVKNNGDASEAVTAERVRLDVNVKAGDVKGKVQIENDWDSWGRYETVQGKTAVGTTTASRLGIREAWMLFPLPSTPVNVKAGHMLLQLGNGWFFRSLKWGSDAWVAYTDIDALHFALVNIKAYEGINTEADDVDAYMLLATMKPSDTMKFGLNVTMINDRRDTYGYGGGGPAAKETKATNVGLIFDGKTGPVDLKAEIDVQTGKAKTDSSKFKGNQVVLQGKVNLAPVDVNFTLARGTGQKAGSNNWNQMITFLDADPHYTILYEYRVPGPCGLYTGFCNTTAVSAGAMFAATNTLSVGADFWFLQATEKVANVVSTTPGATTRELGMEVDVKINWKIADNVSWNWTIGYLDPGKGLGRDAAMGGQGVLSMKF